MDLYYKFQVTLAEIILYIRLQTVWSLNISVQNLINTLGSQHSPSFFQAVA